MQNNIRMFVFYFLVTLFMLSSTTYSMYSKKKFSLEGLWSDNYYQGPIYNEDKNLTTDMNTVMDKLVQKISDQSKTANTRNSKNVSSSTELAILEGLEEMLKVVEQSISPQGIPNKKNCKQALKAWQEKISQSPINEQKLTTIRIVKGISRTDALLTTAENITKKIF